jgi:hypothetical protein
VSDLDWLLTNIDRIGVAGLLAFALLALFRGWLVLGPTHKECRDSNARLEAAIERYVQEDRQEKAAMRNELELLRRSSPTRRRTS